MNLLAIDMASLPLPAILVSAFAVIFILYVYISKAVNAKKTPAVQASEPAAQAKEAASAPAAAAYTGTQLIGVEEKEAAIIMAIVSYKTGISLNRLRFDSIKLMED